MADFNAFIKPETKDMIDQLSWKKMKLTQDIKDCDDFITKAEELLSSKKTKFETYMEIGCDCVINARVDDTSTVFVDVGGGNFESKTLPDALKFIKDSKLESEEAIKKIDEELKTIQESHHDLFSLLTQFA
eukprot:GDKJ01011195.1.p1 GENE.GDKJ01011195.1~~GDKJ01011195.1.p1  ORF type:complete len:131 (+),score=32.51 GDKJ01011195.1:50-442(+)